MISLESLIFSTGFGFVLGTLLFIREYQQQRQPHTTSIDDDVTLSELTDEFDDLIY